MDTTEKPGLILRTARLFMAGKELLAAFSGLLIAVAALMGSSESNEKADVSYAALSTKVNHLSEKIANMEGQIHFLVRQHTEELQKLKSEAKVDKDKKSRPSRPVETVAVMAPKREVEPKPAGKLYTPPEVAQKGSAFMQVQQQEPNIRLPSSLNFIMKADMGEVEQFQEQAQEEVPK